jgi:membrane-associated phospholipid phosphatase
MADRKIPVETFTTLVENMSLTSPYVIYMSGLIASLVTSDSLPLVFVILAAIFGDGMSQLFTRVFRMVDPKNGDWMILNPPERGCKVFPSYTPKIDQRGEVPPEWGMPSSYAQLIGFSSFFWIMYIWRHSGAEVYWKLLNTLSLLVLSAMFIYARMMVGCSNMIQSTVGFSIGGILAIIVYSVMAKLRPKLFKKDKN